MKSKSLLMCAVVAALLFGVPLPGVTATITQLTFSATGDSGPPVVSADGSTVAFSSTADLTGENPDGGQEIFVINVDGTNLLQLTNTILPTGNFTDGPSITADGSLIAFRSSGDLAGVDPDFSADLFLINADGTGLRQPTIINASGGVINANGTVLVFFVGGNPLGQNSDGNFEIFIVNVDGTNPRQLTN